MLPGNRRKQPVGVWIILLVVAIYVGYCIGAIQEIRLDTISKEVQYALLHPLPIQIKDNTLRNIGISCLVWAMVFLQAISKRQPDMPGREQGTARFELPEVITKRLSLKTPRSNKILSEHLRLGIDGRKTKLNNNVLVIGGSGAGKSKFFVTPNIYEFLGSYLLIDPSGELLRENRKALEDAGFNIKVLNLIDEGMDLSDGYNPFAYIRTETDVIKLITNFFANTTPQNVTKGDPFWEKAEMMFWQSLFYYVWKESSEDKKNFETVLELLNNAKVVDEEELSELDNLMFSLQEDHIALITYKKVRSGTADIMRSIIVSAHARAAYLQNPKILRILSKDDMNLSFLGRGKLHDEKTKTAIFCVIPDNDKSYNFIVGMLYTQLFQELYYHADFKCGGVLPLQVMLWQDEFDNVAMPEDFLSLLSTMRKRGVSSNIIVQNLAQLKARFKEKWEEIPGNCDTIIYLGGNEQGTHKYISELLGKWTIYKKSSSENLGTSRGGGGSNSYDVLGRELMTPDEVRKMSNDKCIVFIRGQDPVIDTKYPIFKKKEYMEAQKTRSIGDGEEKVQTNEGSLTIYGEKELAYFKEKIKDGAENISLIKIRPEDIDSLELEGLLLDENITAEDVENFVAENKLKLQEAAKEDAADELELEQLTDKPSDLGDTLAKRLAKNDYTSEQRDEASKGIENGLSEELVLTYFRSEYSPEEMAILRKLAEKTITVN